MKTFDVRFQREFTVQVHAPDIKIAELLARDVLSGFPRDSVKILSIIPEGYVEPVESVEPPKPVPPRGNPTGGGSPGTPTASVPVLVDQIAKVA